MSEFNLLVSDYSTQRLLGHGSEFSFIKIKDEISKIPINELRDNISPLLPPELQEIVLERLNSIIKSGLIYSYIDDQGRVIIHVGFFNEGSVIPEKFIPTLVKLENSIQVYTLIDYQKSNGSGILTIRDVIPFEAGSQNNTYVSANLVPSEEMFYLLSAYRDMEEINRFTLG